MKTINAVFISNKAISLEAARNHKKYSFNTEDDLKPGDVIIYAGSLLMVTEIFKRLYHYYNRHDGNLSSEFTPQSSNKLGILSSQKTNEEYLHYKLVEK